MCRVNASVLFLVDMVCPKPHIKTSGYDAKGELPRQENPRAGFYVVWVNRRSSFLNGHGANDDERTFFYQHAE